jgi:3-hydroxyisobutyrate dehydrogenase
MSYSRVAIIGAGIMGKGIISNLQKKNIPLSIFSRDLSKIKYLENLTTKITDSLVEVTDSCSHIILCLTEDKVVSDIYEKISKNSNGVLLDFGTTSPELTELINIDYRKKGNIFLDSPMTGSKIASETGQIVFMVGSDSIKELESCDFIWKATGKKIIHCGKVGMGQKTKIALNMMQAIILQSYMEGLILAENVGVNKDILCDVISSSAAKSGISDFKLRYILENDYSTHFSLKNMNKDLNHALTLANKTSTTLPLAFALKSVYNSGLSLSLSEEDFCSLMKVNYNYNSKEMKIK